MNKRLFASMVSVSTLALLASAASAMAAVEVDVEGENATTGYDSHNTNDYDVKNHYDLDVDNHAKIKNKADVDVNTGYNEQNKNTTSGDQESGMVDATVDWENVVNSGSALLGGASEGDVTVEADFSNDTTGAYSHNRNDLDVKNKVDIDLDNFARVFNKLDFDANTGYNEQNKNTEAGDQTSGDATLMATFGNWVNNGSGYAGASAPSVDVDVEGSNHKTGADSHNTNDIDVKNKYDLDVDNHANIKNKVDVDLNTGYNEQNKNTTGGDQTSGDADVTVGITNSVNNGTGAAAAGGSSTNVEADLSNDTTGADSHNTNDVDVKNTTDIDIDNHATVENKVDVDANTGYNEQNKNTEGGSQTSGDVNVDIGVTNEVNS